MSIIRTRKQSPAVKSARKPSIRPLAARDLLNPEHPLHRAFAAWVGDGTPTKRQATKYLQANPALRDGRYDVKEAA